MNKTELMRVLDRLDLRPSRRLGQNFLIDGNTQRLIAATVAPIPERPVLEVGPGTGVLTAALLDLGARVVAVEYDHRLVDYLRERFANERQLTLVEADAARIDPAALVGGGAWDAAGNLPYRAASAILGQFCTTTPPPENLTVLLQLDMAERLVASPGTRAYGALTVALQCMFDLEIVRRVPATVFWPPPQVESALVRGTRRSDYPRPAELAALRELTRRAFSARRKQLRNALAGAVADAALTAVLEHCGLAAEARPAELPPAAFRRLCKSPTIDGGANSS